MRCPACAATVDDDAAICPKCDHIIDASFLDGLGDGDEDTDPGATAPALDDDDTDPGAKAPPPPLRPPVPKFRAAAPGPRAAAQPRAPRTGDGGTQVTDLPPGVAKERAFDASSQLMDDYGKLATDVWQRFLALSAPAKVGIGGAAVALVSTVLPFQTVVTAAGITDDVAGVSLGLGLFSLVLAGAALGLAWYRLAQQPDNGRLFTLIQSGIAGLGILVGVVCLFQALALTAPAINPHHYQPGAGAGIFINLTAWTAALIGSVVGLKDG